jgi:uncharacterized protein YjbJ (UPF0337 family)
MGQAWSVAMVSLQEIAKPLARAINIYRRIARRELDDDVCRDLARHIKGLADQGIADSDRLTVHGLSYLNRRETGHRRPGRHKPPKARG